MAQIKTLRKIGERMGWSPAKVLRRHKLDDFPLYPDWTKRGIIWVTSDELILEWEQNKVRMNQGARLRPPPRPRRKPTYHPYNWRLRYKNETPSGTIGGALIEEKRPEPTREEPPATVEGRRELSVSRLPGPPVNQPAPRRQSGIQRIEGCVCGTGLACQAHDEPS
jgi:hypothetical protein